MNEDTKSGHNICIIPGSEGEQVPVALRSRGPRDVVHLLVCVCVCLKGISTSYLYDYKYDCIIIELIR